MVSGGFRLGIRHCTRFSTRVKDLFDPDPARREKSLGAAKLEIDSTAVQTSYMGQFCFSIIVDISDSDVPLSGPPHPPKDARKHVGRLDFPDNAYYMRNAVARVSLIQTGSGQIQLPAQQTMEARNDDVINLPPANQYIGNVATSDEEFQRIHPHHGRYIGFGMGNLLRAAHRHSSGISIQNSFRNAHVLLMRAASIRPRSRIGSKVPAVKLSE